MKASGKIGSSGVEVSDSVEKRFETNTYRVIQNDCRGFNNLSYTIHLR